MKSRYGKHRIQRQLIEKSVEAYILSLETINRLSIKYRVENFAFLICNAWELMLKAKIIDDTGDKNSIFYKRKRDEPLRSISLGDCIKKKFPIENDPTRRNLEKIIELRDAAVHLIICDVPLSILGLFQSCVLNYHKFLVDWFEISLSDRVSVGMMTIVYDFDPAQYDLKNPVLRRRSGKDIVEFLTKFQAEIQKEYKSLNGSAEYSINISYKLALVQKTGDSDIVLSKGESGLNTNVIVVPKDPCKTHPFRQTDVVERINAELGKKVINRYDVQCIIKAYEIKKNPEYFYLGTIRNSTAQYSEAFVLWALKRFAEDNNFFFKARQLAR